MKVLLSTAIWGRKYVDLVADYSVASLLAPNNIPRLSQEHEVTCHFVTTREDLQRLREKPSVVALERVCRVLWEVMEDHDIAPGRIPRGIDDKKYPFLSRLQNIAITRSLDYDAVVFNYADFIWADGSLSSTIGLLSEGVDGVLSFCLPVDLNSGIRALDETRSFGANVLNVPPRALAHIAVENLHREAQLRFWEGARFTNWPTYVLWQVGDDGILIRAYHQTALVMRVKAGDPRYRNGITRGSLDGYFTSYLAEGGRVVHVTDSDSVMVFSLYQTTNNSRAWDLSREEALRQCLCVSVSDAQRRFAQFPIRVKQKFDAPALWTKREEESWAILSAQQAAAPFDQEAYERMSIDTGDIDATLRDRTVSDWVYRQVLLRLAMSPVGAILRRYAGAHVRRLRLALERWVYGKES